MSSDSCPVVVIGGGPVGAMQTIFLANKGLKVGLYESKKDIRSFLLGRGRSINLALSYRGREALRAIGCEKEVVDTAVPMYSRFVHLPNGKTSIQPYGTKGQAILSVDRQKLNEYLLSKAEEHPNVKLHFEHKLIRTDIKSNTHSFMTPDGKDLNVEYSFTFGCDGAYSTVRRQLMRWDRLDYSQTYIEHGYKELTLPPNEEGDYVIPPNHLHIWPRQEFMMIALPNLDKSFTLTLFMPFKVFERIESKEDLLVFFQTNFPDCIDKIGVDHLVKDFFDNPLGPMVSIKCHPHYLNSRVLIMGDAAHAVVPFYGQGLNTGMEDCLVYNEFMSVTDDDLHLAAQQYSKRRWRDAHGIADLSMYNYLEMRAHVTSRVFLIRKYLDNFLHRLFPSVFVPLYTMVAFTRIPIHKVIEHNEWQKMVISRGVQLVAFIGLCVIGYGIFKLGKTYNFRLTLH